jgi:uncharacterized protein YjeT (DUF2065 family)
LGGLLLLLAAPVLAVARWHASPWRLVIVIFTYVLVIVGMWLVLSPYAFRKAMARVIRSNGRCRIAGALGLVVGLAVFFLGLKAY